MTLTKGFLVLESGETFPGLWQGEGVPSRAGEVVFNTSHSGYEEIATDPSYYSQIIVMTAPQQGNYGEDNKFWESEKIWIEGFVCVELQNSKRDQSWQKKLTQAKVPILTDVDTRQLTLKLREQGTPWGALVSADSADEAVKKAKTLILEKQKLDKDWVFATTCKAETTIVGDLPQGPKVAALDLGCKENSIRELKKRTSEIRIFPSRTPPEKIRAYNPDGIFLSNGPGDPKDVQQAAETVKDLVGWRFIFGICMGHQILGRALGGETYKLKFGHRGSNHPIKDVLINKIYMSSQNHGYAVRQESLPSTVKVTHTNLNDGTVAGIYDSTRKAMSVQFHPESHPGPHEASALFDFFTRQLL